MNPSHFLEANVPASNRSHLSFPLLLWGRMNGLQSPVRVSERIPSANSYMLQAC